jgi:hypothetical protein
VKWHKLGLVFAPDGRQPWMRSHAANPIPEWRGDDRFRIYFSTRDDRNRSSIGFVEIDIRDPQRLLRVSDEPVLGPGELAMFDDSGVSIGCIASIGGARYLYYMGWHLTVTVPWQNALGLAVSESPNAPFRRISRFPIVELTEADPYTISYPWVMEEDGLFRMWYGSNVAWGPRKEDMRHLIKYAESRDGIHWERPDVTCIGFDSPDEYAICKPCVVKDGGRYRMWFCARGAAYRVRYAESEDGIAWNRMDEPGAIDVSLEGWDAEMIEYPCVFDHKGVRYMLYAGNGFGRTGFGLAQLDLR